MRNSGNDYTVRMPPMLTEYLDDAAANLGISREETISRAIVLMRRVAGAKRVQVTDEGKKPVDLKIK